MTAALVAALRAMYRSLVSWSIALALVVVVTVAFWPAFKGASGISAAIETLPDAVIGAFGLRDFGSPAGFLRGNLYELLVPLLFSIAIVVFVNGQTAADEAAGRLELFLAQPVSRRAVFGARLVACLLVLTVIVVVTIAAQLIMDRVVGLEIDTSLVLATAVLCGLLAAVHGSLAYCIACLRPQPSLVLAVGIGVTLAGYLVLALFPIATALAPWKAISPWAWAFDGDPLVNGAQAWRFAALLLPTILLTVAGTAVVARRDVAAA